jgi:hypothetical protein
MLSIISINTKQSIELGSLLHEARESKTGHSIQLHVHGKLPHMVSRSLLGPHCKMYANTPTSTTQVQQHQCSTCCLVALALHQLHPCAATTRPRAAPALHQPRHAPRVLVSPSHRLYINNATRPGALAPRTARRRLLRPCRAIGCLGCSCGSLSTTSPMLRVRLPRLRVFSCTGSCHALGHCVSRRDYSSSELHRLCCAYAVHPNAPSRRSTSRRSVTLVVIVHPITPSCVVTTRHVARLVTRLVAPLVVEYFTYATRPGASAHRAARHAAHRRLLRLHHASGCLSTSRGSSRCCRLLRLCRASGCLGTSPGLSRLSSSTTSPTPRVRVPRHVAPLVVDYFAYVVRPGASARHAARRRLLRLRRASGCLGTSRGSSSTTSPTLRVRVPQHVARLVSPLVVDYVCAATLSCGHTGSTSATWCIATTCLAATLALLRVRHAPP